MALSSVLSITVSMEEQSLPDTQKDQLFQELALTTIGTLRLFKLPVTRLLVQMEHEHYGRITVEVSTSMAILERMGG